MWRPQDCSIDLLNVDCKIWMIQNDCMTMKTWSMFSFNVLITVPHWACSLVLLHVCTLILILILIDIYIYNWECSFVCLFVRGKRQNYGTDWRQTLRNYEERHGKCPLRVEIARLSVLGEISWHFRFFVRGRPPFFTYLPSSFGCCLDAKTTERIDTKRSGITKNDTESVLRGLKLPVLVLSRRYCDISGFSIVADHHDAKSRLHIFQCMQSLHYSNCMSTVNVIMLLTRMGKFMYMQSWLTNSIIICMHA